MMGADFLERTKKAIKRSWDRERVALATSDLLTRGPDCAAPGQIGGKNRDCDHRFLVCRLCDEAILRAPKPPAARR